jgi:hypothetical protein
MLKTVYAIITSALVAGWLVGFPDPSIRVEANAPIPGAKSDRADVRPAGSDCSQRAWPYFESACLHDSRLPLVQPREARFVTADRTR